MIEDNDFPWLETLDLSYNRLTTDDVLALGALRLLKVLHLTGKLTFLSPNLELRSFFFIVHCTSPAPNTRNFYTISSDCVLHKNKLILFGIFYH